MIFKSKFRVKDNTKEICFSDYFYGTRFVDRVEQKVTTNPKLGENHKSRSTEEAAL